MKLFCRAFCVFVLLLSAVRAAEEEDPETFGDYAPTLDDDLIQYVPKHTVHLGFRDISGVKAGFGAKGFLASVDPGATDPGHLRNYHDGFVGPDARMVTDPSGRNVPIAPDGRTNTWQFKSDSQVDPRGYMMMHSYTAQVTDESIHSKDPKGSYGVELALDRDLGRLFKGRVHWGVVAGLSINQFSSTTSATTAANVTTQTDYYSLGGQIPPAAPYTAPNFNGAADISVLLGLDVLLRQTNTAAVADAVLTSWHLRGAYMTFRAGPTLSIPIGARFSANISAGAVLVYAGSTTDIVQNFRPATGDEIVQANSDGASALLPGFYVDANVQWDMTENAGLYLGGVYQNSGDYTQTVASQDGKSTYTARIDLSQLQGVRAGVSFKF